MNELKAGDIEDLGYISRILRGETRVFGKIIDKYSKLMMKLAGNYLNSREEVEDAAQEIFLEIYRSLDRFQLNRRFFPWIYSIALNVLKRKYKKNLKFQELHLKLRQFKNKNIESDPSEIAENEEKRSIIQKAVNSLPSQLHDVVVMYYLESLNIKEICDILNLGSENVKSRLFRARKKLKKILSDMQLD